MILFVDDEPTVRELSCQFLRLRGLEAEGAATVAEALGIIERLGPDLKIAVVDHELPDGTGYDIIRGLRTAGLDVPILYVSGYYSLPESDDTDIDMETVTFFRKPYELPDLVDTIRQLIGSG